MELNISESRSRSIRCIVKLGLSFDPIDRSICILVVLSYGFDSDMIFQSGRRGKTLKRSLLFLLHQFLTCVDFVTAECLNDLIGGAAITCKNELEKIHDENLEVVACQLRQAMLEGSAPSKVIGMDWSKRPGSSEISCDVDDIGDQKSSEFSKFVVVHGAG